jgi:hypothetical protein
MRKIGLAVVMIVALAACQPQATTTITPDAAAESVATETNPDPTGHIAFQSNRDNNLEIYVMNADGSDVRRITNDNLREEEPALSLDGTQVIFQRFSGGGYDIVMLPIAGGEVVEIVNSDAWETSAAVAPDFHCRCHRRKSAAANHTG